MVPPLALLEPEAELVEPEAELEVESLVMDVESLDFELVLELVVSDFVLDVPSLALLEPL